MRRYEQIGKFAEYAERRDPCDGIGHHGGFAMRFELMGVAEGSERPRDHLVNEAVWAVELYNFCCDALPKTKMYSLESNRVAKLQQARRFRPDDSLLAESGRFAV